MKEKFTIKQLKKTLHHQKLSVVAYDYLKAQYKKMKCLNQLDIAKINLMYQLHNGLDRGYHGSLIQSDINMIIREVLAAIRKEISHE